MLQQIVGFLDEKDYEKHFSFHNEATGNSVTLEMFTTTAGTNQKIGATYKHALPLIITNKNIYFIDRTYNHHN